MQKVMEEIILAKGEKRNELNSEVTVKIVIFLNFKSSKLLHYVDQKYTIEKALS